MVPQPVDEDRGLLAHRDRWGVQVADVDAGRRRLRRERLGRQRGQLLGSDLHDELGQQRGQVGLERDGTREPASFGGPPVREVRRDLLVRAVLQQPGEQQVTRLQELEVLGVLDVRRRQQPGGLEVEQRRGHDQELRRAVEVPLRLGSSQVRDELVRDLRERDLGDVELVLRDQAEQQVERTREVVEVHLEAGRPGGCSPDGFGPGRCGPGRRPGRRAELVASRGRCRLVRGAARRVASGREVRRRRHGRRARARAGGRPARPCGWARTW
ncbi:hypothetical protein CPER28S_00280 [Cellulomonas persica]